MTITLDYATEAELLAKCRAIIASMLARVRDERGELADAELGAAAALRQGERADRASRR